MRSRQRSRLVVAICIALLTGACAWQPEDITPKIPQNAQSSKVYAADGSLLYTAHGEQNRIEVPLTRIPTVMQRAVIAIEDERFYDHAGVDIRAVFRALQSNAEEGQVVQGGSTITQQLVKITLLNTGRDVSRKLQEASLAYQLEQRYSKDQILEIYLNTIYFGNGSYGVEAASETYFGHPIDTITASEAALLAGLVHAPNDDDPIVHPEIALARRNVVLAKMLELGYLGRLDHDTAAVAALGVTPTPLQARYPAAHFVEEVKRFILTDTQFGATREERENLLFNGGLRIATTLDPALQAAAEQAVAEILPDPAGDPEAAVVSIEPRTGYVKAMVGGRDYFGDQPSAKCNLATNCNEAHPGRSTGSAFKPFTLAAALAEGIPLSKVITAPSCIDLSPSTGPWHVCNADPGEGVPGGTNLIEGTVHSYNTLYAQLVLQVGPDKAVAMANKLGITSHLDAYPSATLGSNNIEPLDMADAYATFANRGVHVPPTLVTKVSNAEGDVLYEAPHTQEAALDSGIADEINSVLQQVIERGTGRAAALDRPAAGKTGTGQDYKNAWFCGYTPELSTAVWVGFASSEIEMSPPTTRITVYGGTWPAQIWQRVMTAGLAGTPPHPFTAPTTTPGAPDPQSNPNTTAPGEHGQTEVPSVIGLSASAAVDQLAQRGLRAAIVEVADPKAAPGTVTKQIPAAGSSLAQGSTVTIQLARGPQPAPTGGNVVVPDVIGRSAADATAVLNDAGLSVGTKEQPESAHVPASRRGVVWHQSPDAGTTAPRGSTVNLLVNP
ncbi:MAG: transglycosylase domain-containing protein [Acidimicrobiales bacterium]